MKGSKIIGQFNIVIGNELKTNLQMNFYDRILLKSVYHELINKDSIMTDIYGALKQNGQIVIMETMATRPNQKRKDCGKLKPWEPTFLKEIEKYKFTLINKEIVSNKGNMLCYTFKKQ